MPDCLPLPRPRWRLEGLEREVRRAVPKSTGPPGQERCLEGDGIVGNLHVFWHLAAAMLDGETQGEGISKTWVMTGSDKQPTSGYEVGG